MFYSFIIASLIGACVAVNATDTMYVFAYSWTPGFCYNQTYPGCIKPQSYWTQNLTIHGLWPQYITTGYPSSCTTEPFDPNVPYNIGWSLMTEKWPDVQYSETDSKYDSFWEHEWTKHGTCSGLSQHDYFMAALNVTDVLVTPPALQLAIGQKMATKSLINAMGGSERAVLQCKQQNLVGIYTCWSQIDNVPGDQIDCPASVLSEDTCKSSDMVYIADL